MQGQIVWFNPERRFGFVENSDGKWFFHVSNVVAGFEPKLGAFVEFDLADPISLKQPKKHAINVRSTRVEAMVEAALNAGGADGVSS
jgi:cold shock CspA family protein